MLQRWWCRRCHFFPTVPQVIYKSHEILPACGVLFFFFLDVLNVLFLEFLFFFSYCEWVPVHSNQMTNSAWAAPLSLMGLCILSLDSVCYWTSFQRAFYRFLQIIIISLAIIIFFKLECFFSSFNLLHYLLEPQINIVYLSLKSYDHGLKFSGERTWLVQPIFGEDLLVQMDVAINSRDPWFELSQNKEY